METLSNVRRIGRSASGIQFGVVLAIVLLGGIVAFPLTYISATNVIIGLLLFPYALFIEGPRRYNVFYLAVVIAFGTLAFFYEVKMFYFLSLAFMLIVLVEAFLGRVNPVIVVLVGAMSPVFHQLSGIFGFPIRLKLSEIAGNALQFAGADVEVEGNMMTYSGISLAVDDACMGLNMLSISMLLSVFVFVTLIRRERKTLSFLGVAFFFSIVFVLNIVSNLFRIILLVLFKTGPENPMHEILGLAGLMIYVIIPAYFIGRQMIITYGRPVDSIRHFPLIKRSVFVSFFLLSICIMTVGFSIDVERDVETHISDVSIVGMREEEMGEGMRKFSNDEFLVYVKPIPEFFSGEHTPLFCWEGSGYEFQKISTVPVDEQVVYSGVLTKDGDKLYTAWWYTDGKVNTISQLTWRSAMLKTGSRFCLVNVTTASHDQLKVKVTELLTGGFMKR